MNWEKMDEYFSTAGVGSQLAKQYTVPIIATCVLYLPLCKIIENFMKKRKPFDLKYPSILWNLFLSVLSFGGLFIAIRSDPNLLRNVIYSEENYSSGARFVITVFCLTKIFEFVDTLILLLKKKNVIFLHSYHHLTVALYCWHAQYMSVNFAHSFVLMNLFVHGIMYAYYAVSSLKKSKFLHASRPIITILQIVQMLFGIYVCSVAFNNAESVASTALWWNVQMGVIMYISYAFLFFEFYLKTYHVGYRPMMCAFMLMFHIFAVFGLYLIVANKEMGLRLFLESFSLYVLTGFGITCGAHRLWSHRSYKAHYLYRFFLMILNSIANQGTIFHWSRDHRVHHKYSEKQADPHNATRGFFYSHIGWLLLEKPEAVKIAGREIDMSDLLADPIVMWQKRWDPWWNQFFCFVIPSVYGYYVYGSFWLAFFTLGCLRWIICLHATWTINSVAHIWGDRPYNVSINPAENLFASVVAIGEGWHNWHHEYPFDYAAAEGGFLTHFNPSKMLIDLGAALGMVHDRRRATDIWGRVKLKRLAAEKQKAEAVAAGLNENSSVFKLSTFRETLPKHVTRKSLVQSTLYLFRDLIVCSAVAGLTVFVKHYAVNLISENFPRVETIVNLIFWILYAIAQGTAVFGLWVLGYEAAGGRFSDYRIVNHVVGLILHSIILVPYKPRRAFREKERERASLCRCLSEDAFAILKIFSWKNCLLGSFAVGLCISTYAVIGNTYGWVNFIKYYVGPWFVLNIWLTLYEWLLDNGPQDNTEFDLNKSTLQLFTAEWLLTVWPIATQGRKYPWTRFVDHLHHHLALSHVVQAVDLEIPHYHLKDVFRRIGEALESISSEMLDVKNQMINAGVKITPGSSMFSSVVQASKYIH